MSFILAVSPYGVFALMVWVVAAQGPKILGSLGLVLLAAYIGYIIHVLLVYTLSVKVFAKMSPMYFFKKIFPAAAFAFTSTSSVATLPITKECCDEMDVEGDISSFVLPLGATINMDGTAIYQCVAAIFLAKCVGIDLTLGQMVMIVITATLASSAFPRPSSASSTVSTVCSIWAVPRSTSSATLPAPSASTPGRALPPLPRKRHKGWMRLRKKQNR